MGLIKKIFGIGKNVNFIGKTVEHISEVFVANKTQKQEQDYLKQIASINQFSKEFTLNSTGWFNGFINSLNRLPRPCLALGTFGLFFYAMFDPVGFSSRMIGLGLVPDPLWWLLGAIVSFYFGARELHYFRGVKVVSKPVKLISEETDIIVQENIEFNAALEDWQVIEK